MNSHRKLIITGTILAVTGIIVCGISFAALGFDFKEIGTTQYVTNTYEVEDPFTSISFDGDVEDISFKPSEDGKCKVVCFEEEDAIHSVTAEGDTLRIRRAEEKNWFSFLNITTESPSITVYLPEKEYKDLTIDADTSDAEIPADFSFANIHAELSTGDITCLASVKDEIKITTSTGDVAVSDIHAGTMSFETSTGKVSLSDVTCEGDISILVSTGKAVLENVKCKNLTSDGSTGDIKLKKVAASGSFRIERSTGDVEFDDSDAEEIFVETDTGDVTGTLSTDKVFITDSDTGSIDVPKTIEGGRCEISTDTGDISISIE